ncbi:alpha/beta fold hydrolase [Algibacillus agarilyticus]|uniref:alpha/beta fold hydrolase n=1 Tax=Algibacillus agarilyticus TaxID=2234133 RepID=UPI000DD01452|nr:alpha/beta fold hydrolase [Algibacillus agarilyticus]
MQLNYTDKGTGPVLVLIHGLLGSLDNLNMVARSFNKQFRTISVDLRNHGSSAHLNPMDYPTLAQDVFETLDALAIDDFTVLGHSMGGKVAMQMALQSPARIERLIVADIAPITYPERHQQIFNGLNAINLSTIKNRTDADITLAKHVTEPGVRQFLLRNLVKEPNGFNWKMSLNNIMAGYQDVIGFPTLQTQYTKPTLFIKGGASEYITREHQTATLALFPSATAKVIQGAGHWLHAEKTVIFNKIVHDFLSNTTEQG